MRSQASMGREHERLAFALLLSLLSHTLLLSLIFGGQGLGLPGFGFPWRDRRIEVPDVRVVLVPTHVRAGEPGITSVAKPVQQASIEQRVASGPAPTPSMSRAPRVERKAVAIPPAAQITAGAKSKRNAVARAAPVKAPTRADGSDHVAPGQILEPAVVDAAPADRPVSVVDAAPSVPTPVIAVPPSTSSPETVTSAFQDAGDVAREAARRAAAELKAQRQEVERQEDAARVEAARREAERQEAARLAAAQQDAQRQELARQEETARVEAARREVERQEAAQRAAAQLEAQRQEVGRQEEAARVEAARREAERQEAARREAERQEAARLAATQETQRQELARQQETARVEAARREAERREAARRAAAQQEAQRQEVARQEEAARVEAARREAERREAARVEAQEAAARREAALRAIGRQLDEEAARRQAATASADPSRSLPPPWTLRRYRLFGRTDPNQDIILYAEAWERKIHLNMTFDMVREAAKQPHTDPIVKVAIRSDGSVESVTFVVSSGVAALDDAIQRVVDSQKPYRVFPPSLAREYDVIEIRRTWHFDTAIRLY